LFLICTQNILKHIISYIQQHKKRVSVQKRQVQGKSNQVQLTVTNFFGSSTWLNWELSQGQIDSDSSMLYLKDCHTLCRIELLTVSFYNKKLIEVNIKYLLWQLTSLAYLPEVPLHTGTFCTKSHISMLYIELDWGLCSQNWDMKTITSFHSKYTHTKRHNRRSKHLWNSLNWHAIPHRAPKGLWSLDFHTFCICGTLPVEELLPKLEHNHWLFFWENANYIIPRHSEIALYHSPILKLYMHSYYLIPIRVRFPSGGEFPTKLSLMIMRQAEL
jgi:hypothetical protein